jgi:sec-independent protein translocase protein TatA
MGTLSVWHWLIVLAIVLIFFGGSGKISGIMGDFAKGIKSFKKGMAEDEAEAHKPDAPTTTGLAPGPIGPQRRAVNAAGWSQHTLCSTSPRPNC